MNTDRRGATRPQWRRHRSRRRFTSARSHSSATSVFLENEPAAAQKTPDSIVAHRAPALLRRHLLQHGRRVPYPIQQPTPMRLQKPGGDTRPSSQASPSRSAPRAVSTSQCPTAQLQTAPQTGDGSLQPVSRKQHVREDHSGKVASSIPTSYHWPMGLTPLWISIWCRFRFTFIEGWRF